MRLENHIVVKYKSCRNKLSEIDPITGNGEIIKDVEALKSNHFKVRHRWLNLKITNHNNKCHANVKAFFCLKTTPTKETVSLKKACMPDSVVWSI